MTSHASNPVAAPWRGAVQLLPRAGGRGQPPAEELRLRFRVRGAASAELALLSLLAGWALLWSLFLLAVA